MVQMSLRLECQQRPPNKKTSMKDDILFILEDTGAWLAAHEFYIQ